MAKQREDYSGAEKMAILREHLIERMPISEVCQKHGLQSTAFQTWQKRHFEGCAAVFENCQSGRRTTDHTTLKIDFLQARVQQKKEALAELMEALVVHVAQTAEWAMPNRASLPSQLSVPAATPSSASFG